MSECNASITVESTSENTEIPEKKEVETGPPAKKSKASGGESGESVETQDDGPYPFAKLRGIRIFSEREINGQDALMTREYWTFWNTTAEELCSDGAYNDWGKRDLKLYIDGAWVVHKTHLLEQREKSMREGMQELQERYGALELPLKLRSEDENVTELLAQVRRRGNSKYTYKKTQV